MRLFECSECSNVVYFENRSCNKCGSDLGYVPTENSFLAQRPAPAGVETAIDAEAARYCRNSTYDACNWYVEPGCEDAFCRACRHNGTIPDLTDPEKLVLWRKVEVAKHRLFYSLMRWNLPLQTRTEDSAHGLIFHFLADPAPSGEDKILTGHDSGVITIALVEADDAERERRRSQMSEPYRTLLGHFRHEVGHYYWDILVGDGDGVEAFRALFGDERADYGAALATHYANGSPPDWAEQFVSGYATAHPWEDFAETWAHYFHIVDTLEMANAYNIKFDARVDEAQRVTTEIRFDPYREKNFAKIVDAWFPFVSAINNINRAIGRDDLYPFILSQGVIGKLTYIHELIRSAR